MTADRHHDAGRTPAQVYSLVFGATLLIVGIVGFFVNSGFDTGSDIQGDDLILFEVNGWHNIVHILSGLVGLALARRRDTAYTYALGFGIVYGAVAIWGFAQDPILNLIPVNTEDNILHILIAGAGIAAALASKAHRDDRATVRTA
ncbi:MAG: DUF4383 domain-containing protein [Solirubrobacteraceae bacterium]